MCSLHVAKQRIFSYNTRSKINVPEDDYEVTQHKSPDDLRAVPCHYAYHGILYPGLGLSRQALRRSSSFRFPVIIASYFLGFKGGMFFGLVFGLTSVIKCFTEPDAFAMIIMNAGGLKTVGLMIICLIVPRIMIGVTSRAVYTLFNKFDKTRISSMAVAAFVGTITNTILFLGAFYLFAKDACMAQFGAATADALFKMMLGVVTLNGIIEAVASVIICTAVGQALYNFIFKKRLVPADMLAEKDRACDVHE